MLDLVVERDREGIALDGCAVDVRAGCDGREAPCRRAGRPGEVAVDTIRRPQVMGCRLLQGRLAEVGREDLQGRLAVDNAKLAYQHYLEVFAGPRWETLAAAGARPQRCLWASTSTKNPAYRDVLYVEELIGPETVNTMPLETVRAFQDHGEVRPTLEEGLDEARDFLDRLAAAGVDYDDVTDTLEREGVEKFADSFRELIENVEAKRGQLVGT